MELWVRQLHLPLVEHGLQSLWLDEILAVEELNLKEVLAVIEEVDHEINNELFHDEVLVELEVLIETVNQGVHLLIDRWIVSDLRLNYCHFLRLAVLRAVLKYGLAVLIDLLLEVHLGHVQLRGH